MSTQNAYPPTVTIRRSGTQRLIRSSGSFTIT